MPLPPLFPRQVVVVVGTVVEVVADVVDVVVEGAAVDTVVAGTTLVLVEAKLVELVTMEETRESEVGARGVGPAETAAAPGLNRCEPAS